MDASWKMFVFSLFGVYFWLCKIFHVFSKQKREDRENLLDWKWAVHFVRMENNNGRMSYNNQKSNVFLVQQHQSIS